MQKIIVRNIAVFSFVGLLLVALVTFSSLSETARLNQDASAEVLLEQVAAKLVENEQDIENLKSLLSTEYIEKARAFAHMIKLDPSIIEDKDELNLIIDEIARYISNEAYSGVYTIYNGVEVGKPGEEWKPQEICGKIHASI